MCFARFVSVCAGVRRARSSLVCCVIMVAGTVATPGTMEEAVAFQLEAFLALEGDDEQCVGVLSRVVSSWLVALFSQAGDGGSEGIEEWWHYDGKAVCEIAADGFERFVVGLDGADSGWSLCGDTRSLGQAA